MCRRMEMIIYKTTLGCVIIYAFEELGVIARSERCFGIKKRKGLRRIIGHLKYMQIIQNKEVMSQQDAPDF